MISVDREARSIKVCDLLCRRIRAQQLDTNIVAGANLSTGVILKSAATLNYSEKIEN